MTVGKKLTNTSTLCATWSLINKNTILKSKSQSQNLKGMLTKVRFDKNISAHYMINKCGDSR